MRITVRVNGDEHRADCWEGESLLFALREKLGFPGSKNACEQGECGSCSVLLDGMLVCACLVLAAQAAGEHPLRHVDERERQRIGPSAVERVVAVDVAEDVVREFAGALSGRFIAHHHAPPSSAAAHDATPASSTSPARAR